MKFVLGAVAGVGFVLGFGCDIHRRGSQQTLRGSELVADASGTNDAGDALARDAEAELPVDAAVAQPDAAIVPIGEDARDVVIGHYAERRNFRTIQQVKSSIFEDEVKVLTTSYSLVQILRQGSRYLFRENACRVEIVNEGSFISLDVTIDDRVPQSIPLVESEVRFENSAGGITWVRPLTSAAVGFIPEGPDDALPTEASDPRVVDSEGDGNPGVSAHVRGKVTFVTAIDGDLYLAQWNRARYAGIRQSDGSLEGENFDTSEQNVLGSDDPTLAANNPPTRADPNTIDNRIVLVPLAQPVTCATLLADLDATFN